MPSAAVPCFPSALRCWLFGVLRWVFLGACGLGVPLWAASLPPVTLEWDPNREKDLAGYELSYGTAPGRHSVTVAAGLKTQATVAGLVPDVTYYFVVRAYNRAGQRSAPSAEVAYRGSLPNQAPSAVSRTFSTRFERAVAFSLSSVDQDGDPLSYEIVSGPRHGRLSGKVPKVSYQPAKGFSGTDLVTFRVHDGKSSSETATIRIIVEPAKPVIGTVAVQGRKYRTLTFPKSAIPANRRAVVEVSSNLVKWFSGRKHTVVLRNDGNVLRVRDKTPLTPGRKRFIRVRLVGQ